MWYAMCLNLQLYADQRGAEGQGGLELCAKEPSTYRRILCVELVKRMPVKLLVPLRGLLLIHLRRE